MHRLPFCFLIEKVFFSYDIFRSQFSLSHLLSEQASTKIPLSQVRGVGIGRVVKGMKRRMKIIKQKHRIVPGGRSSEN